MAVWQFVRPVPPCDGECVTDTLISATHLLSQSLALIALLCVANTLLWGLVVYFMGQDYMGQ